MARKSQAAKGPFFPKNPGKYFGGDVSKITYRSSWEWTCMKAFDEEPSVIGWSSETCSIPYYNPFTKKQTVYIPDFLIVYQDRNGRKVAEMIEVKPAKEVPGYTEGKLTPRDRMAQALNQVKWAAAQAFCKKRGIKWRVMTEFDIYTTMKKK